MTDFNSLLEELEENQRGLDHNYGDKIERIINNIPILISYKYLILKNGSPYSFNNQNITDIVSEEFANLSDFQIYLSKIQFLCTNPLETIDNKDFKILTNPSKKLKEAIKESIDIDQLDIEQIPVFAEIRLYTNKKTNRAPRVYGFLSNANIFNIICYDPFHSIYNATYK